MSCHSCDPTGENRSETWRDGERTFSESRQVKPGKMSQDAGGSVRK